MKNTKKTKRTFKIFAAWDYEFEEKEYDRMSEKGWQLVNGSSFTQKYEFDDSVIYRYQIDFNNGINDMARYEETFRDAGWQRVNSTANGWHIFRKAYDPKLPEEEYQIYTDNQSRVEMLKRWRNVAFIMFGFMLINVGNGLRIMSTSDAVYIGFGLLAVTAMFFFMLITGVVSINRMSNGGSNSRPFPMAIFLLLLLFTLTALIVCSAAVLINEGSYLALGFMVGVIVAGLTIAISAAVAKKK